jgi:hypothetical protein
VAHGVEHGSPGLQGPNPATLCHIAGGTDHCSLNDCAHACPAACLTPILALLHTEGSAASSTPRCGKAITGALSSLSYVLLHNLLPCTPPLALVHTEGSNADATSQQLASTAASLILSSSPAGEGGEGSSSVGVGIMSAWSAKEMRAMLTAQVGTVTSSVRHVFG